MLDKAGAPVPGALVRVVDEAADRIVLTGTTYGDGRVPFYPHLHDKPGDTVPASASSQGGLIVQVSRGAAKERLRWKGEDQELTVTLNTESAAPEPIALDVIFLIADAPPHMDYEGDVFYGESLKIALAKGIRIHSVAASGIDEVGSLVFRQVAQFTRGKFIFIEYGTVEESAAAHGVTGKVKSNNLDDILFEQIREEVARWGR